MEEAVAEQATVERTGRAAAPAVEPVAKLEIAPPARVAVGRGSAFVIGGYCYVPGSRVRGLAVEVDGERTEVRRFGLPRRDLFEDAGEAAFHSGFLAMPRLSPRDRAADAEVGLRIELASGEQLRTRVGRLRLEPALAAPRAPDPVFPSSSRPRVAICMATHNPPQELLRRQLESLAAQTHSNWTCVISDDRSRPEHLESLRRLIAGDRRFALSPSETRLGFYGNFERALSMAPAEAEFVALCDQDDRWHPTKLERLLERMQGPVQLAYSDARVVDEAGRLVHDSYWTRRRNNCTNLASLLIANTVTGAAAVFRRELLEDVLPFPPRIGEPFHDHWLSLVALARGEISYVEEPLYDYVQHPGAVIGHGGANRRPAPVRQRLLDRLRAPGDGSRVIYYYNWSQAMLFATVLGMRCSERMAAPKRRALERFVSVDAGFAGLTWLVGRRLRRLWGRNETMDIERFYAKALLRQRAVSLLAAGRRRPGRWVRRDASIPPPREAAR